ncbi:unnamed protein product [Brugia pahangi]|uniref:Transmembrane protein n=1 Tax=Brugia pahangi TaxID=6280 RepID=A0A0N4T898_BRUPA|nr:unnamed protein product [Brugia pahangi]
MRVFNQKEVQNAAISTSSASLSATALHYVTVRKWHHIMLLSIVLLSAIVLHLLCHCPQPHCTVLLSATTLYSIIVRKSANGAIAYQCPQLALCYAIVFS